ncbi:MAG: hypothetical protein GX589_07095 [Deltaproteobacteria bacterium]|nr:hypothetical protein [Deltaproteobacteria bacterium]
MSFKPGDTVHIIPLKKSGLVSRLLKPGHYQVTLGSMQITCRETDLESRTRKIKATATPESVLPPSSKEKIRRLDLHGLRVAEAMNQVESAINRAILCNQERLEILHGIGSGKIKEALHRYLEQLVVVKNFKLEPSNPGVTVIYF